MSRERTGILSWTHGGQFIHVCDDDDEGDSGNDESEEEIVIRDFPYQHDDWRIMGDHSRIIKAFGELNGYPVYAMHRNVVLHKFVPEGWTYKSHRPALVYQVWQDHAFFYEPHATNGVQCKQVRVPQRMREEELLQRHDDDDDDDVVLYDAMVPYTEEALIAALDAKEAKVFYVHGGDLSSTAERLNEGLRLTFTTSFEEVGSQPVPSRIRALFFKLARGRRIVIRKIPSNAGADCDSDAKNDTLVFRRSRSMPRASLRQVNGSKQETARCGRARIHPSYHMSINLVPHTMRSNEAVILLPV